jgi:hypothetical protein
VGVQHPMVLILRKSDMKLISCSTKNFVCHESVYTVPLSCSSTTLKNFIQQDYLRSDETIEALVEANSRESFGNSS